MKILNVKKVVCFSVKTDGEGWTQYTRYSAKSWTVTMGESEEQLYDYQEIEQLYQEWIANNLVD